MKIDRATLEKKRSSDASASWYNGYYPVRVLSNLRELLGGSECLGFSGKLVLKLLARSIYSRNLKLNAQVNYCIRNNDGNSLFYLKTNRNLNLYWRHRTQYIVRSEIPQMYYHLIYWFYFGPVRFQLYAWRFDLVTVSIGMQRRIYSTRISSFCPEYANKFRFSP